MHTICGSSYPSRSYITPPFFYLTHKTLLAPPLHTHHPCLFLFLFSYIPPVKMASGNYRSRFLWDVVRWVLVPSIVLRLSLGVLNIHHLGWLSFPSYLGFILVWAASRGAYARAQQEREARSLGARTIPCVVGKWPGNVDVLLKMLKAFKTSYVLDVYRELFEEYQCTTLNLRILWRDSVCKPPLFPLPSSFSCCLDGGLGGCDSPSCFSWDHSILDYQHGSRTHEVRAGYGLSVILQRPSTKRTDVSRLF